MKRVNGVKIPKRKTTSPQFRSKWLKLIDDLQPYMDKYGYKMLFASTNDDETVVYDLGEANDPDMAMKMLSEPDTSSI